MIIGGYHGELTVTDDSSSLCSLRRSGGRSPGPSVTSENLPLDMVSGDKASLTPQVSSKRGVTWPTLGATLLLGCCVVAGRLPSGPAPIQGGSEKLIADLVTAPDQVESGLLSWQIVPKNRRTAPARENCMAAKCCNIASYYYYEKNDILAQCAKTCSPSASNLCRPASETLQLEPD